MSCGANFFPIQNEHQPDHSYKSMTGRENPTILNDHQAHNLKVEGSNPSPATIKKALETQRFEGFSLPA